MSTDLAPVTTPLAPARVLLPHEFDEETLAKLAALDDASDEHAASMRPDNTVRGYASDWKTWSEFAEMTGIPVTAVTRGTLRTFVRWLWVEKRRAPSTIDRKITGVMVTLRRPPYNLTVDKEVGAAARELLASYEREAAAAKELPRGRGKAPAMRIKTLQAISAMCPDTLRGVQERAVVLLAFAIAGRRAEVAALLVRSIEEVDEGLRVDVRVSKTHPRVVPVPYGVNPLTCPVRAWKAWKARAAELGADPDSPAFRQIHRSGSLQGGYAPQGIGNIITAVGARAGAQIRFTGHSVRSGMATEARRAGKDRKAIAGITGHKPHSPVLDGYIQLADEFDEQDNALFGIGL